MNQLPRFRAHNLGSQQHAIVRATEQLHKSMRGAQAHGLPVVGKRIGGRQVRNRLFATLPLTHSCDRNLRFREHHFGIQPMIDHSSGLSRMHRVQCRCFALLNGQVDDGSQIVDIPHGKDVRLGRPHVPADHQPTVDDLYPG